MREGDVLKSIHAFIRDESGTTAIEYGLIAGTIALGIILSLNTIKDGYTNLYIQIQNGLKG
jgi:pilus assembly protein Flp/PilA